MTNLAVASLLLLACAGSSPDGVAHLVGIEGRWEGALVIERARQPVILDVQITPSGYRPVITLPTLWRTDSAARLRELGRGFELVMGGGGERLVLVGERRGDSLQMTLQDAGGRPRERSPTLSLIRRGPSPAPTMRTDSFTVQSSAGPLPATLLLPGGRAPHPAIVLVHGSGRGPRAALMPLAQQFAARGVATLVYEKRPITRIGGEELTPGEDLAADALSAVEALARRPDIRPDRIGLWGGSQGSGVAALAASRSSRVAFVVSVSGGGTPYTPFALFQAGHRLRARNLPEATVTEALSAIRARHQYLRGQIDSASLAARLAVVRDRLAATGIPLEVPSADERRAWERVGHQRGDAASVWRDVRVPVLAIWGGRDRLVPPRASAVAVGAALRGSGSSNNNVVCVVPNADHGMLLPGGPGVAADGGFAFPELARPYREGMLAWVREQSGLAPRRQNAATFGTQGCVDPSSLPPDEGLPPDR